ncbi:putative PSP1-like protein [Desulfosporosinus acidiphilus SJ4]|uniref:Putative PSP1-like protein n=1 Tax=Desulfosporosinus acidiphilus (strain DSM 22704 / JCM 16185 / SJ4) TaxID=646529 RepID=I4D023_DESAJ|nr:stage 0 sporulation family protein [Desulfosporosinus acidiphilus]AFM39147.1 putative PSP1-like protein [Desulfosporosinus acidiphilus SJ4]
MIKVVGVRFKNAGKIYYFSPGDLKLEASDRVIVETARGIEFGELVIPPREVPDEEVVLPLKQVIRKATPADEQFVEQNRVKEKEAFQICLKKISDHQLPMKLVDVEYTFDGNKIIFSFTAEGRVDFRELVKDLAAIFRTRIELRQIGVRDEAKMLGGVGSCGRILCCTSFLGDFEPVSIRMAKDQKLSLNPTKISGICGRLMCCLKYENGCYRPDDKELYPQDLDDAKMIEILEEPNNFVENVVTSTSKMNGKQRCNRKGEKSKGKSEKV